MLKLGIDVGGTFTDIVLQREDSSLLHGKAPSTPGDESKGVVEAIGLIARKSGLEPEDLLARVDVINFGTTVATNAMLQQRGVTVGMLTTRGFRDIVELRRGWKERMFDLTLPPPPTIVPRRWRLGVSERIGADGTVVVPLDEDEVRGHAVRLREAGVESIAVCFLFSFVNPVHERRAREIAAEHHPAADIFLSSEVLPKIREYERFSTTAVNAYLSPHLKRYLDRLMAELRSLGYGGRLYVMRSNGGTVAPELAGEFGCAALLSGPAAGVVAATRLGEHSGVRNIIGVDMGGTSYDVSLIRNGVPETSAGSWFSRHYVGLPMLDIHTIGAGGGSLAWIDDGGALKVGPESAGARPGPACYAIGGTRPTVTDAFLCLGYLDPGYFLGGAMRLDPDRARAAVDDHVGAPLGMETDEAAFSILRVVNNDMANAIRYVSVSRGIDPRDFVLMSFGGASSVTVSSQARDLGIRRVLVPRAASVLCALGELWADFRVSQIHAMRETAERVDLAAVSETLETLAVPHATAFADLPGVTEVRTERSAELHYLGQTHEIKTPIASGGSAISASDWQAALKRFHALHLDLYAFQLPEKPIEVLSFVQDVVGVRPASVPRIEIPAATPGTPPAKASRPVCFSDGPRPVWRDTPIYDGARIRPGHRLRGPAVVEEIDTTVVLQPGDVLTLNDFDVYEIAVGSDAE